MNNNKQTEKKHEDTYELRETETEMNRACTTWGPIAEREMDMCSHF